MEYNTTDLKEHLTKHNIKPSNIRIKVLDYLLRNKNHPTANEIYEALIDDIPTLSKTSIYNTLDKFLEEHLVSEILLDQHEARYDVITKKHGHFKCEKCNRIYDFELDSFDYASLEGFIVKDEQIQLYGICKDCR